MKIIHHTTSLRTIQQDDIEQIRLWRNREHVNSYLKTKKFIDAPAQLAWFRALNTSTSIYFIIEEKTVPCGVIYTHNIDLNSRSFEGNIFTGDSNYLNTPLPVKASIMLTIFFFEHLLFDQMFSTVHYNNSAAAQLDTRMGFKVMRRDGDFIFSRCSKVDFEHHTTQLKKSLLRNIPVEVICEKGDERYPFLETIKQV